MTTGPRALHRDELQRLHRVATGTRTPRGAVRWAARTLRVSERTVGRWLAGETSPTARQLAELEVRAGIQARQRAARRHEAPSVVRTARQVLRRVGEALGLGRESIDEEAVRRVEAQAAAQTRANAAFRDRGRDVELHPYESIWARRIRF